MRNPDALHEDFQFFSPQSAWDFIASRLEGGEEVTVIEMREPSGGGRKGYVMKIDLGPDHRRRLYIKIQLGSGRIIGRSFHYTKYD